MHNAANFRVISCHELLALREIASTHAVARTPLLLTRCWGWPILEVYPLNLVLPGPRAGPPVPSMFPNELLRYYNYR